MKAVGYIRVSSEEQAKEGYSLDAQRSKLTAYAALYDIDLVAVVADEGISAKSLKRAALQEALTMLRKGEADGLIITKLDRLSRSVKDWNTLIDAYFGEKQGKQLMSVSDCVDTRTAAGRLVLNVLMSVFQWEREATGERTREVLTHRVRNGFHVGRCRYGYTLAVVGERPNGKPIHKLVENPQEQRGIARMRELRDGGLSYRQIGTMLSREGYATKDGKPWAAMTIRGIIERKVHCEPSGNIAAGSAA